MTIEEYKKLCPNADVGEYPEIKFKCKECGVVTNGNSAVALKHIKTHGFKNIHEYNMIHEIKYCKCGCGNISDYSFPRHIYNEYIEGHCPAWNKDLTIEDERIKKIVDKGKETVKSWSAEKKENISQKLSIISKKNWEDHPERKAKMTENYKITINEKYGVSNYFKTEEFKVKKEKTSWEVYGTRCPCQSNIVQDKRQKRAKQYKKYTMPDGTIVNVQGYEPYALDILLKIYKQEEIITLRTGMPEIWYYTENKKKHRYYPDIFIPKENLIIEVKSKWTYDEVTKDLVNLKCETVKSLGHNIEIWIIEKKKLYKKIIF